MAHLIRPARRSLAIVTVVVALLATLPSAPPASGASRTELGINVLLYPQFGSRQANLDAAKRMFSYVASLNANTVAICFEGYPVATNPQDALTSSAVTSGPATPTANFLAAEVDLAHAAGLQVELRPLINEDFLHSIGSWRGAIAPSDPAAWFASYASFLRPYLIMSRAHQVESFVIGAELNTMAPHNRYWAPLVNTAKQLSGARIVYEANWNSGTTLPKTDFGIDFYQPLSGIPLIGASTPPDLTSMFTTKMESNLKSGIYAAPTGTSHLVLGEVSVSAVDGGWTAPWSDMYNPAKNSIIRSVQANWFTAACNAVKDLGLGGLDYWTLILNVNFDPASSDATSSTHWQGTESADAIRACFARF